MVEKYYSIITNTGKALEAAAIAGGKPIILSQFVVGDGSGQEQVPDPTKTALVNEKYRHAIAELVVSPDQASQMLAHLVLPADIGGFTVREIGLLTEDGKLYALANCAAIEKPIGGININMQFRLAVAETSNITLKVATGDGLFLRIDKNLNEIALRGEKDKSSACINIGALQQSNNLSDVANKATSRSNLGVYSKSESDNRHLIGANNLQGITNQVAARNTLDIYGRAETDNRYAFKTITVNGKPLSNNVMLNSGDVGAISNIMPSVDNTTITKLYDPSIVRLSGGVTLAGYFEDHPLGATFQATDTLMTYRRWYNAGSALTQYLHCTTGTIYVRVGAVSTTDPTGWQWRQVGGVLPFGWRKIFDTANPPTAADVGALPLTGGTLSGDLTVNRVTTLSGPVSITSPDLVYKRGNLAEGKNFQTNGYRLYGRSDDLFADIYHWEEAGSFHSLSFHVAGGGADGWFAFKNDGSANFYGSDPSLRIGDAQIFQDGNIYGRVWNGYLNNWLVDNNNNLQNDAQNRANNAQNNAWAHADNVGNDTRNWVLQYFVMDVRLGSLEEAIIYRNVGYFDQSGYVITGVNNFNSDSIVDWIQRRPLQIYKNGTWFTVGSI